MTNQKIIKLLAAIADQIDDLTLSKDSADRIEAHLKSVLSLMNQTEKNSIVEIWSDGACSGNPGPGGWGTIIREGENEIELSGNSPKTTNNIMELTGALEGIKTTAENATIILTSDSQYLVKGMTEWLKGWKKKGWKKSDGKPVLNKDIWIELDEETSKRTIQWKWVKGHVGHPENERCDELARQAIMDLRS